eukprot:TRINITY_DN13848_c0_g2_i1.p1 TRINITY_DN13848_c0_g2~~TRINITY_DN13848_c0_g2_i1.p1  ORF type:complete len:194 (-),score=50.31 TRINITY_DN13848_c0_g2_i1:118-669(-)
MMGGGAPAAAAATSAAPAAPAAPAAASGGGDLLDLDLMGGGSSAPAAAPAQEQAASFGGGMSPGGFSQAAPAAQPPAPILAPLQVTTQQVGGMWGSLPTERRVQIPSSVVSCQDMMLRLQRGANIHPVEIIGNEGIAAGRVLPGTDACFLHGKVAPQRIEMLVRCRDPGVAQKVVELCQRVLV